MDKDALPNELSAVEIQNILPHRYPILLVDRIVEMTEDGYCKGIKAVSANEPSMHGHFPGNPVFPGVLIIEAMAQVVGVRGLYIFREKEDRSVYLVGVEKAKFRRMVMPGDLLELEGQVVANKRNIWFFDCKASVDGKLVAEAKLSVLFGGSK